METKEKTLEELVKSFRSELAEKETTSLLEISEATRIGGLILDYNYFMETWFPLLKEYFFEGKDNGVTFKWFFKYRSNNIAIVLNYNPNVEKATKLEDFGQPLVIFPPLLANIDIAPNSFDLTTIMDNSSYEARLPQRYENITRHEVDKIKITRNDDITEQTIIAWKKGLMFLSPELAESNKEVKKDNTLENMGFEI